MGNTIIQIKAELQEIALKHKQINGFFFGQFNDAFSLEDKLLYPVMICQLLPGSMTKKNVQTSVSIAILDKITEEDFDQQTEVLSDCQQICADIKNIFSSYRFEDYTFEDNSITLDPIIEERADLVSGWVMNFSIDSFDSQDYCAIPIEDYDFENSPFIDCSTGSLPVPTDCPAASVSNSDDSFTASVAAGGSLELADVDLNINGGLFSTNPSVQDLSIEVRNESGVLVGVPKPGNTWEVPDGGGSSKIIYNRPALTGEQSDYGIGSDGRNFIDGVYNEQGDTEGIRAQRVDFYNLDGDNALGNKKVFTGITGGYKDETDNLFYDVNGVLTTMELAWPDDYIINHDSGWAHLRVNVGSLENWDDARVTCSGITVLGFNDFTLPNTNVLKSSMDTTKSFYNEPFLFSRTSGSIVKIWTGTTGLNPANARFFNSSGDFIRNSKTTTATYGTWAFRKHYK